MELISGTGLCGLMIAKEGLNPSCHATVTDLPKSMPLLQQNVARNFGRTNGDDDDRDNDDDDMAIADQP